MIVLSYLQDADTKIIYDLRLLKDGRIEVRKCVFNITENYSIVTFNTFLNYDLFINEIHVDLFEALRADMEKDQSTGSMWQYHAD